MHSGARGVMAIVVGNGHVDTISNLGRSWLHFYIVLIPFGKSMNLPAIGK